MKGSHFIVNIGGGGTKSIFQGLDDEFATKIHGSGYPSAISMPLCIHHQPLPRVGQQGHF
eukprot:scaffold9874_cov51-Cyclotella_meneghiniana.AAC.5